MSTFAIHTFVFALMMLTSIVLAGLVCACLTPDKNPEPKEKHIVISLIIGFALGIGLFNIEVGADRYKQLATYSEFPHQQQLIKSYAKNKKISHFESWSVTWHYLYHKMASKIKQDEEDKETYKKVILGQL